MEIQIDKTKIISPVIFYISVLRKYAILSFVPAMKINYLLFSRKKKKKYLSQCKKKNCYKAYY